MWTLSNICAGSRDQVQVCIDCGVVEAALKRCVGQLPVVKEACWLISNITCGGDVSQIEFLIEKHTVSVYSQVLNLFTDTRLLALVLEGLHNILKFTKADRPHAYETARTELVMSHGLAAIKNCQTYEALEVCRRADRFLENYFDVQDPGSTTDCLLELFNVEDPQ